MIERKTKGALYRDLREITNKITTTCVFVIPDKKIAEDLSLCYFAKKVAYDEAEMPRSDHLKGLRKLRDEVCNGEFEKAIPFFEKEYRDKNSDDWRKIEETVERGIGIAFRNLAQALS